jgi:hypothetical protein
MSALGIERGERMFNHSAGVLNQSEHFRSWDNLMIFPS